MGKKTASDTSLLPQYYQSALISDRFFESALTQDDLQRAINKRGIKLCDEEELLKDNLKFFQETKVKFQNEFYHGLLDILVKKKRVKEFERAVILWCRGKYKAREVLRLKRSVYDYYFGYSLVKSEEQIRVKQKIKSRHKASFEDDEIDAILRLNREMLDGWLVKWLHTIKEKESVMEKIYLRRGLGLASNFNGQIDYKEKSLINSYSLAITIPEKFSKMRKKTSPTIVNANYGDLRLRILFFTPFIKRCPYDQFEMGIIPHYSQMNLTDQGIHARIQEYELNYASRFQ